MSLDKNPSENKLETGSFRPSQALLSFLEEKIKKTDDFYKNLASEYDIANEYDITTYKEFEDRFISLRKEFKDKSQIITDPDYEFLNHTTMRKNIVEQIISCASIVVDKFQEAREQNRLHRSSCTDALENLVNAMNNLKHLIEEQGKI